MAAVGALITGSLVAGVRGHDTSYGYDGDHQLTSITDPTCRVTIEHYVNGLVDSETLAAGTLRHVTAYAYNLAGQLSNTTDAKTHVTSYLYDAAASSAPSRTRPMPSPPTPTTPTGTRPVS